MDHAPDTARLATPIGMITVTARDGMIEAITIGGEGGEIAGTSPTVREATAQLRAWFAGERTTFDLPLRPLASARGQALRDGMIAIPHGDTLSYGALARSLRSSPRAIGQACARNRLPLIVPCHRVLGAGGTLAHYSAGDGPATKAWLLAHEARQR